MRVPTPLAIAGLALSALIVTACSSESKTTAAATQPTSTIVSTTATTAAATQPTSTVALTTAATSAPATTPAAATSSSATSGGGSAELDTCTLLTAAQASTLVGRQYTGEVSKTIAPGQDQCTYATADNPDSLVIIVYQPTSGVSMQMMTSVLGDSGEVTNVSGVGDKAIVGEIELDAQAGKQLIAIQGSGGNLAGDYSKAIAVAKAVIAALP